MIVQIQLTPEELFFLGRVMKARYIDYGYYAAMKDIQKQFAVCERRALSSLGEKGLIEENFSGDIEVIEEAAALMRPVFFGRAESRLKADRTYNIHISPEGMTMGFYSEGRITFLPVSDRDLEKLLKTDCIISCANVDTGFTEKKYSREELKNRKTKQEALRILKGGTLNV